MGCKIVWFLWLSLALVACKTPSPTPTVDAATTGDDGTALSTDADAVPADSALSPSDALDADIAPQLLDNGAAPDSTTIDTQDIGAAVTPVNACDDGKDLPQPGQPCSKEGEMRCTRVGESTSNLLWDLPTCLRPNQVVCSKAAGGALLWTLNPCAQVPTSCTNGYPTTCQENSRGAHCCPASISFNNSKIGGANLCEPGQEGALTCLPPVPGAGPAPWGVDRCTFTDTPAANANTQAWKTPQGECAPYCKDCLFYLPEEICPMVQHGVCKFTPGPDGFDYKILQWCLTDIPGKNGPACMKNCDDWKYAPDYGK